MLGESFLGLNGLFTNILSIVSVAELGVGAAINFSLYKPVYEKNIEQIKSIMRLYRNVYRIIGISILMLGIAILPFLNNLIHGSTAQLGNIYIYFVLFLLNSVFTYFWSYKGAIFLANQYGYIYSINTLIFQIISQGTQIYFLFKDKNYYVYLLIQILFTICANINISHIANKYYPFLKDKNILKVDNNILKYLKRNVIGMFSSKVGGIVVNGTDNLILSAFLGLKSVAIYSNYTLIINGLISVVNQGISAVTASLGNLHASNNRRKEIYTFYRYTYFSSIIAFSSSAMLITFLTPFVGFWVGKNLVLNNITMVLIVINYYVNQLRQANINTTNAYGLYWEQRVKPIVESVVNIVISITLVKISNFGILSVIIGTLSSNLFVNSWWEPLIIVKKGLNDTLKKYFIFYSYQLCFGVMILGMSNYISLLLKTNNLFYSFFSSTLISLVATIIYISFSMIFFKKRLSLIGLRQLLINLKKRENL